MYTIFTYHLQPLYMTYVNDKTADNRSNVVDMTPRWWHGLGVYMNIYPLLYTFHCSPPLLYGILYTHMYLTILQFLSCKFYGITTFARTVCTLSTLSIALHLLNTVIPPNLRYVLYVRTVMYEYGTLMWRLISVQFSQTKLSYMAEHKNTIARKLKSIQSKYCNSERELIIAER